LLPFAATAETLFCERMLDVREGRLLSNVRIETSQGRIDNVKPAARRSGDVVLADLTCLPGLTDLHVHITTEFGPKTFLERLQLDPADHALRSVGYAERTLMAGFTTVRDLGGGFNVNIALRNAINAGRVKGPRIFTAGKSLATTGGHADPTNGMRFDLEGDAGPRDGVIDGADDAHEAVRWRYKDGADLIKLTATGGVLSVAASGQNAQFTDEELATVIAAARDYGFHVAAHAHGTEGMKRAIRAGVRTIEHGTFMDEEAIALFKAHGTWYIPTIAAGRWVAEKSKIDGFFPDLVRPKAAAIGPQIEATFTRAYRSGVKIAFGTDTGVSPHGDNAKEFQYMVEAGMPAAEAIRAATTEAAIVLDRTDDMGAIEPGKYADIIAVAGNPLDDIRVLQDVRFVMKEGVVFKAPAP
jgi:imidazolonepropionase-like amidohydrolase